MREHLEIHRGRAAEREGERRNEREEKQGDVRLPEASYAPAS